MKKLRDAFLTGFLVLVPLLATIQLVVWFVQTLDENIRSVFPAHILPFDFKGLGVVFVITLILMTGLFAQNFVGELLVKIFDKSIRKVTIVGGIYSSIKKFLETIFHQGTDQFHGTVLVQFPRQGIYSVGFRTGKPDPKLVKNNPKKLANIFVPCTPNPTSGFYLLVPEEELTPLDLSVQEAFKIIISMGIVSSEDNAETKNG